MKISISIENVFIELDDETARPSLDAIESLLTRTVNAAVDAWSRTEGDYTEFTEDDDDDNDEQIITSDTEERDV